MAVTPKQNPPPAYVETVEEIMRTYRSLPPRPTIDEVEAAMIVLKTVNNEEQMRLEEISKQEKTPDVPEELFSVLQEIKKNMVLFQSYEQRKEALHLVDIDNMFQSFDELIQRASSLVSGDNNNTQNQKQFDIGLQGSKSERKSFVNLSDESLIKKKKDEVATTDVSKPLVNSSSTKTGLFSGEDDADKLSLLMVAGLIETSAKTGAVVLDLKGKLMDKIEWLPLSIGKLSDVIDLDISENRLMALPSTIGSLGVLTKLDIHSNQLINLPDSFCELVNLTDLDLHANRLRSLPDSIGNLTNLINLNLSSNQLNFLPDSLGNLIGLKRLNVDTNELQELPYTIGSCASLVELKLDFNNLKALPEAIGKLERLEILTIHYNRIKKLPSTMGNLSNLKELDVSFNELESIPENLCFATSLVKLNVGRNFADLTHLPRSIGNLEMLEELDIGSNQIRILPESFRLLSKLRVLYTDETPLEVPPRQVTKMGAQAVVQYMIDLVEKKDVRSQPSEARGFCFWFLSLFWPRRRKQTNDIESITA
ncbi:Leucine-rich repeat [Macleaya cordata]|uniref:Leucine-rich repeat n=1 Tax=Macleaya cordata TaxID=56857 RepID=A0A200PSS1_MACCD|nr:Leucine-rich repeat [Macleaya cordata]